MLTGEYAVLDGALALAIPTKLGQYLKCTPTNIKGIQWKSIRSDGTVWYKDFFDHIPDNFVPSETNSIRETLISILSTAKKFNPEFLATSIGWEVSTRLEFPEKWGLGSSSTLINNIAQWAKVDAFHLLHHSFGGSGYDIAAAQNDRPLLYQLSDNLPVVQTIALDWNFVDDLFFVYLNRKQDSKEGIRKYREATTTKEFIDIISDLTIKIKNSQTLSEFESLVEKHESIVSKYMDLPKVKEIYFSDYSGCIKSLGAWGGDFILASGNINSQNYFREKGFETILSFKNMIV